MHDLVQRAARAATPEDYTAADIEVLEGLEPVRRRPGMFIGGTDERALHHLAAELLDNAMDEAVAGHASWIEVRLEADGAVTVRDNGRGIPIDPHPKFPDRSALEVILTTLHSGGKFGAKVYQTAGGLHGVGLSVVNALAEELRSRWRATASCGARATRAASRPAALERVGADAQPPRHDGPLPARPGDLRPGHAVPAGAGAPHGAQQGLSVPRRRDPLAVRSRAGRAAPSVPAREVFHFPAGLEDFLKATLAERACVADLPFVGAGRARQRRRPGRMGDRLAARRGALQRLLLQHHADPAGRLARAGAAHALSCARCAPTAS